MVCIQKRYDVSHEYVRFISEHGMEVTFPLFQSTAKYPVVDEIDQLDDDVCGSNVSGCEVVLTAKA